MKTQLLKHVTDTNEIIPFDYNDETLISEAIKKWNQIGFLQELDDIRSKNTAISMESIANLILLDVDGKYNNVKHQEFAFPIARRIFGEIETEIEPKIIFENSKKMIDKLFKIDYEAEFCSTFSDNYKLEL